ncbi:hypothetical protein MZM54_05305 [[Brevibacterium] frigoritolerans]|nr:hypothetical protein [Peribacillus frigoritolerans]
MFNRTKKKRQMAISKAKYEKWKANYIKELEDQVKSLEDNVSKTDGYTHQLLTKTLEEKMEWLENWKEGRASAVIFDGSDITLTDQELRNIDRDVKKKKAIITK